MLTHIVLENFKSFLHEEFDVRPLTLMAGLNSSGKSSIIQALRLASPANIGCAVLEQHGNFDDLRCRDAEIGKTIRIGVAHEGEDTSYWSVLPDHTGVTHVRSMASDLLSKAKYICADRLGPQVLFRIPNDIAPDAIGIRGENVITYCRYFLNKIIGDKRQHIKSVGETFEHQLEAWMNEISPGVKFIFWREEKFDAGALQVGVKTDQTIRERPTNVGFGLSYTLPVVATLLGASSGDLVMIENPEAHLHPAGQTKMGELAARAAQSGIQVIIETHSDHLIDGARIAVRDKILEHENAIVLFCSKSLNSNLSSVESISFLQNGDLKKWPKGFCDQSLKNLSKLTDFS